MIAVKNNIQYDKRRMLWKAQNSARSRMMPAMARVWIQAMHDFIEVLRKNPSDKSDAINQAMITTNVEVGGSFARKESRRLLRMASKQEDQFDQQMVTYTNTQLGAITASIERTTAKRVNNIVTNEELTATEIDEELDRLARVRGRTIANEETTRASNTGANIGATAAAILIVGKVTKMWISTIDDVVRDAHDSADGQIVPLAEGFLVGGELLQEPKDPNGSPGNTINCRCVVEYGIEGR